MLIHEKAMIATMRTGAWGARKRSKQVEREVDVVHGSSGAGSFTKTLLNCAEHRAILVVIRQAKEYHKSITLPFDTFSGRKSARDPAVLNTAGFGNVGLLPIAIHGEYLKKVRKYRDDVYTLSATFADDVYPAQKEHEKGRLSDLYVETDYPTPEEIKGKYYVEVAFSSVPEKGFIVDTMSEVQEEIEASQKQLLINATKAMYHRLYEVIQNCYDRLSDPNAVFHNVMIQNIAEQVKILPILNEMIGDEKLNTLTRIAETELANLDPKDLRRSKEYREATAELAKGLMIEMEAML